MVNKDVVIYTDGACSGNPGPGGWAALLMCSGREKLISGSYLFTTNNCMELTAVVHSLRLLKYPCNVTVCTDSAYIVDQVNGGYLDKWVANAWRTAANKPVMNMPLWDEIFRLRKIHNITFVKVKGHSGDKYNNIVDAEACRQRDEAAAQIPA